ncbi:MAG: methyltransferase domain-containing protein [Gammaproteobacteria bacterium]|nr:methyltransferase domain-containing protein [Gammaproteobacteria bacterium]MDH4253206.1 methyltransferase domain-containing protein [Gammaproteobacteria bacterium]MDH5309015.1 methyltransferase domain-containing protein [Gammaproteobacteria bacterium]
MLVAEDLLPLLACPRCDRTPLRQGGSTLACPACKTEFPGVAGIPWLFAEPDATLGQWRGRLHFALQQLAHETQRIAAELRGQELRASTRRRLEHQAAALESHRRALQQLLAPVDVQSLEANYESHLALRTRLPLDQGINTYYANAHRDWSWGATENEASLAEVMKALDASGERNPGTTAVLGAGACRLAYDLHSDAGSPLTVALDFNPLLILIAARMAAGESLDLWEFPLAPRTSDDFAVARKLRAPAPAGPGFHLLLADVLRAPLAPASFDTVLTPWLIDVVGEDLASFGSRINRLLRPGGRWINFGSLSFEGTRRAGRLSAGEVLEVVADCGFAAPAAFDADIPYMSSPASRHARTEQVFTFAATKQSDVPAPARHKALPDWIVLGDKPVPLLPAFQTQALSTRIYAFIMTLIDGKRSIDDMASILEQQKLMPSHEAAPAIRNFLARMYDDSSRNPSL